MVAFSLVLGRSGPRIVFDLGLPPGLSCSNSSWDSCAKTDRCEQCRRGTDSPGGGYPPLVLQAGRKQYRFPCKISCCAPVSVRDRRDGSRWLCFLRQNVCATPPVQVTSSCLNGLVSSWVLLTGGVGNGTLDSQEMSRGPLGWLAGFHRLLQMSEFHSRQLALSEN